MAASASMCTLLPTGLSGRPTRQSFFHSTTHQRPHKPNYRLRVQAAKLPAGVYWRSLESMWEKDSIFHYEVVFLAASGLLLFFEASISKDFKLSLGKISLQAAN
ncbi:hypothetical protein EJ110_NYTH09726 [Nymphaea thermarum]|nr:hypothetical protein EJ110_NYTH09726 [Nymphaea thermarum]